MALSYLVQLFPGQRRTLRNRATRVLEPKERDMLSPSDWNTAERNMGYGYLTLSTFEDIKRFIQIMVSNNSDIHLYENVSVHCRAQSDTKQLSRVKSLPFSAIL
jgi:hypothetical protein